MLKVQRDSILSKLRLFMENQDEKIQQCEEDMSETAKRKLIAAAQGDLSENMEYQTSYEKFAQLNVKLVNLVNRRNAWRIFSSIKNDTTAEYVGEGSCIVLEDMTLRTYTLLLVPPLLGAAVIGAVTTESPVGKAALGKVKNDILEIVTTSGDKKYTILDIY